MLACAANGVLATSIAIIAMATIHITSSCSSFLRRVCVPHLAVARTDVRHFVCTRVARDLIIFFSSFFYFLAFIMLRARVRHDSAKRVRGKVSSVRESERERDVGVSVCRRVGVAVAFAYACGHTLIKRCHVACFHFDVRHVEFLSLA